MKFKAGMRVEACSWERGFEGAWFEGVILSCKRDNCEVQYDKFLSENGDEPLVEKINYNQLRPCPPHINVRSWATGDLVEANENDAWWRGVVKQVLPAQQYYVEFPESKSGNIFHQFNMRARQDWANGKWYLPLPLPLPLPSPLQATKESNVIDLAEELMHKIEVNAYHSVLLAFHARKTLNWKTELLLTNLRVELHITNEEHLLELEKLKLASEVKM